MLRIIALSAIVLSLVACGPSGTEPKNQTTETAPQIAPAQPAKPDASAGIMDEQRNALEKAKEVQGVVDKASDEMDKTVEKNTQ